MNRCEAGRYSEQANRRRKQCVWMDPVLDVSVNFSCSAKIIRIKTWKLPIRLVNISTALKWIFDSLQLLTGLRSWSEVHVGNRHSGFDKATRTSSFKICKLFVDPMKIFQKETIKCLHAYLARSMGFVSEWRRESNPQFVAQFDASWEMLQRSLLVQGRLAARAGADGVGGKR